MKRLARTFPVLLFVLLMPQFLLAAGKKTKPAGGSLLGAWQCNGNFGTARLVFESGNRLVFNGDAAEYSLTSGALKVQENYGVVDYAYTLKGNSLAVTFPDGSQMQCSRESTGGSRAGAGAVGAGGGGSNWQLRGMLCSWSGSSSSGGSYSRSTRVSFDGQGRFSYGSESSFSSGAGQAYGQGGGNSGTYRVGGNQVYLTFSDGSTSVARVQMKQNNGTITELMYNGTLYATGLCE